jgi:YD repeat-containing protein
MIDEKPCRSQKYYFHYPRTGTLVIFGISPFETGELVAVRHSSTRTSVMYDPAGNLANRMNDMLLQTFTVDQPAQA